jgi:peptidoglycan/LPS O-acetylase OafA/YrhL
MHKLSNFSQGRDNNFNLIRIIAALAVLISHGVTLAPVSGKAELLRESIGMTPGGIAVDTFFITSGFLVTASLLNRSNLVEFVWARALRIYPALIIMLLLTVFVLGPALTSLPLSEYFLTRETYTYLPRSSTLFINVARQLPGVFSNNPVPNTNASLWTLPYEVRMYATLAIAWLVLKIMPRRRVKALKALIIIFAALSGIYVFVDHFYLSPGTRYARLPFMFFTGASFYVLKDRIPIYHWLFWTLLSAVVFSAHDKDLFYIVYSLSLAYIVFFLAYIPSGFIRRYNSLGDYSYGIYIYAWPIQQSVATLIPSVSILNMILTSGAITILLSAASWHFIEKHALKLKGICVERTRRIVRFA